MAQAVTSWFICDGRFRVHAINAVGRRHARIIEIEEVESGERFHGSARKLERLFLMLGSSGVGEPTNFASQSKPEPLAHFGAVPSLWVRLWMHKHVPALQANSPLTAGTL